MMCNVIAFVMYREKKKGKPKCGIKLCEQKQQGSQ